jgi:hypothetical protein
MKHMNPEKHFNRLPEKQSNDSQQETEVVPKEIIVRNTQSFLLRPDDASSMKSLGEKELGETIQAKFQDNLVAHYEESGLMKKISQLRKLDESVRDDEALNLVATESQGGHGWLDMLPNLRKLDDQAGMNCTMGSAMLHIALEELGYDGVRTVIRKGHSVVLREYPGGGIKLYDATSLSTIKDRLVGYSRTFSSEQIKDQQDVTEHGDRSGFSFTIVTDEEDKIGGITEKTTEGKYTQKFYAYDPSTKMDVAIALENLSEIKDDVVVEPEKSFDIDGYKQALVRFVKLNNSSELTNEQLEEIARMNTQPIEELVQAAERAFRGEVEPPNPFDFIEGDLLSPKDELSPVPNPNEYKGSSERYNHAKMLITKFPELAKLDFAQTRKQLDLFDAHDYL